MSLPSVTIAMAVYKPNIEWFIKQLKSINVQDYEGKLDLLVWNDSPDEFECDEYIKKHITKFSYEILNNGENNGVTKAFEKLTKHATGKYIAYSDQDDVWMPKKISIMAQFMEENPTCACCHSDVVLINEVDQIVKNTIFHETLEKMNNIEHQKKFFVTKSWTVGCAMFMVTEIAKKALPFPTMIFHDQWLEIYSIFYGQFIFIANKLIQHRIHGNNNSQTLYGITNKKEYYEMKLQKDYNFLHYLTLRMKCSNIYTQEIAWVDARKNYSEHQTMQEFVKMIQCISIRPYIIIFELVLPYFPDKMVTFFLKYIKKEIKKIGIR